MKENLDARVLWKDALARWHNPSIPEIIVAETEEEINRLGEIGSSLKNELAFMKYPEFQTYLNLQKTMQLFPEDPKRGVRAVLRHEIGHRFCPYDLIMSIILRHEAQKALLDKKIPYDKEKASGLILNLFADMNINTRTRRNGDEDIAWVYSQLINEKNKLFRVYGRSMEIAWNERILPEEIKLNESEEKASKQLAELFEGNFFDSQKWRGNIRTYAEIIAPFLEDENKDKESSLDDIASGIPKEIDENSRGELAKRLSEIGSDGLPRNISGLKDFKNIMAGFGHGDSVEASIVFYDKLSDSYNVRFATRPFGRPRKSPFQPIKWNPSMGIDKLDVDYSLVNGGRIIPGVNTYAWNERRRESHGGLEEVVPNLEIYLDSSGSMPNPTEVISLPVLSGFVVAKRANRKGALVSSTNFSGKGQYETQSWTRDLNKIFKNLVVYYNGGTIFPADVLLHDNTPKQVLIITDNFLGNEQETVDAIKELKRRDRRNNVSVYSLHPVNNADYLRNAGAEVIHGTTTDIFKRVIGKSEEVYSK